MKWCLKFCWIPYILWLLSVLKVQNKNCKRICFLQSHSLYPDSGLSWSVHIASCQIIGIGEALSLGGKKAIHSVNSCFLSNLIQNLGNRLFRNTPQQRKRDKMIYREFCQAMPMPTMPMSIMKQFWIKVQVMKISFQIEQVSHSAQKVK